MSLLNSPSLILQDSLGNLENFTYRNENISYYSFNRQLGKVENRTILHQATPEFDADINSAGEIFLVCKKKYGDVILLSNHKGFSEAQIVVESNQQDIYNVNIYLIGKDIHIFYCIGLDTNKNQYKIVHKFGNHDHWVTNEVCQIVTRDILNPIQILKGKDEIILGYYDVIEEVEQLFIRTFNFEKDSWSEGQQLTHSQANKLYLDMLIMKKDQLHITYSEFTEGNLIIKYEKFKREKSIYVKHKEQDISNPANSTHPLLVYFNDKLWIAWSEYNYIASRYTEDLGETWEDAYLWKDSKSEDILMYKYKSCFEDTHGEYQLNYSFGRASNFSFIGFGGLENTRVIPIKHRKSGQKALVKKEVKEMANSLDAMQEEVDKVKKELNNTKDIEGIENERARIDHAIEAIRDLEQSFKDTKDNIEEFIDEQKKWNDVKTQSLKDFGERLINIENYLNKYTRSFDKDKKF
ncbi:hypothetical protein NSA47_00990 [Irregularibacter muris]|uniref:Uncharacterized protein n=1 Tax=Irregularibacter muris TaxID=1796619 RepID=A0AAE3HCZ3_9FIRM|nr:hypothetical protein [Irregularibacter muris]MCR1897566.1 hypothetical protein [Irregularibacter muris]